VKALIKWTTEQWLQLLAKLPCMGQADVGVVGRLIRPFLDQSEVVRTPDLLQHLKPLGSFVQAGLLGEYMEQFNCLRGVLRQDINMDNHKYLGIWIRFTRESIPS
jgi:hypothetical protein